MTDDDDILTAPVPEPDAEPTAAERAHAKAFAELVDKTLLTGRMPPAMSADDRALLEMATVIRATSGGPSASTMELAASKRRSVVEDALRQAIGAAPQASLSSAPPVIPFRRRMLPWTIATATSLVAAAAIALLVLRKPVVIQPPQASNTPTEWRSRPTDPLIGKIENECIKKTAAECAREATLSTNSRIDHIFADRLDGYRERLLARPGGKP